MKLVKTYPGADIKSDHSPVVMKLNMELKKIEKPKVRNNSIYSYYRKRIIKKSIMNVKIRNVYS